VSSQPKLKKLLVPRFTKYIAHAPTPKQQAFLLLNCLDAFYGGAAGGGKSDALLMAALQYVDIPGYNAILFRDTFKNLSKPEGLIPRSHEWLQGTDAIWKDGSYWLFPSGATLSFSYLDGPLDHFNHQSAAYQFVGIDEIVQIRKHQALYLFTRTRRSKENPNSAVPIRFRCASNPPAREQLKRGDWVKSRYVDRQTRGSRVFISARMEDNPFLDQDEYRRAFSESGIDPVTRRQLEKGDWEIRAKGRMFQRSWFPVVDEPPKHNIKWVRYWDMAATESDPKKKDDDDDQPAYTVGCMMGMTNDGVFFIRSIIRDRMTPRHTEALIRQTADVDGRGVQIWMEQEPGSSGKMAIDYYRRKIIPGFEFRGDPVHLTKTVRWGPLASQAEAGNVLLIKGFWNEAFLDEIDLAPDGAFVDQVDAASGALEKLSGIGTGVLPRIRVV
jgi:predicted phage terminase large subunit-like protein